jgi:hypothetical protein
MAPKVDTWATRKQVVAYDDSQYTRPQATAERTVEPLCGHDQCARKCFTG